MHNPGSSNDADKIASQRPIGFSIHSTLLSFRDFWIDEITSESQANRIVRRASRYAFWYWLLSNSMLDRWVREIRPYAHSVDSKTLTPFEAMVLSPDFHIYSLFITVAALIVSYVMKKTRGIISATMLLALWAPQAWFRATYYEPNLLWTPLFIFVVWTSARAVQAAFKIRGFRKENALAASDTHSA